MTLTFSLSKTCLIPCFTCMGEGRLKGDAIPASRRSFVVASPRAALRHHPFENITLHNLLGAMPLVEGGVFFPCN